MKRYLRPLIALTIAGLFPVCIQLRAQYDEVVQVEQKQVEAPSAALLTERGRQLAEQLRILKRSRATMGAKHPTLPTIEKQIKDIEQQLQAWEPAYGDPAPNPFHPEAGKPQLNEYDLRQIVIKLNARVESLEKRVAQLERKNVD